MQSAEDFRTNLRLKFFWKKRVDALKRRCGVRVQATM